MTTSLALPAFATKRLLLRARTLADTDDCVDMDRDPEVIRFVGGPWKDPSAHRAFVERRTCGPWPRGLGYWTILSRDDPTTFIGWVLLIPVDAIGPEIEIGWRLRQRFWGRGFATEAARPVLDHALHGLRLSEVIAEILAENLGSLKVAEKIGLRRRGIVDHDGRAAIRYSLTPAEALRAI